VEMLDDGMELGLWISENKIHLAESCLFYLCISYCGILVEEFVFLASSSTYQHNKSQPDDDQKHSSGKSGSQLDSNLEIQD
jgi:hypothetical protein